MSNPTNERFSQNFSGVNSEACEIFPGLHSIYSVSNVNYVLKDILKNLSKIYPEFLYE